jgi:hypothetical protein
MVLWFMRRKYLNGPTPFLHFCDYSPFDEDFDLYLNKLEFPSCKKCLYQVWLKLVRCFILKDFIQYTHVKIVPPLSPPWPSGTIICTSLNLKYVRKLSCEYELFWLSGSQWKHFQWPHQVFCIFILSPSLKRTWAFIWTIWNSLYPRMICAKFDWNWLVGSGWYFSI